MSQSAVAFSVSVAQLKLSHVFRVLGLLLTSITGSHDFSKHRTDATASHVKSIPDTYDTSFVAGTAGTAGTPGSPGAPGEPCLSNWWSTVSARPLLTRAHILFKLLLWRMFPHSAELILKLTSNKDSTSERRVEQVASLLLDRQHTQFGFWTALSWKRKMHAPFLIHFTEASRWCVSHDDYLHRRTRSPRNSSHNVSPIHTRHHTWNYSCPCSPSNPRRRKWV